MTDREKEILEDMMYMGYDRTSHKKKEIDSIIQKALKVYRNKEELTTIKTSDGKEYDVENDCLIRKSEAIKQIYEKSIRINNPDTQNGLAGAVAILSELKGENNETDN